MKIRIFLILYLSISPFLFAKERMTHTFKSHNFRIELPANWELQKSYGDHQNKPILEATSKEDKISFTIYVSPWEGKDMRISFIEILKKLHLRAENHTNLEQETELAFYNLEGYWAKVNGFEQKKKTNGYFLYANDGVNLFAIHSYIDASLFSKNFFTLKDLFKGFSLNRNYKNECCYECTAKLPKKSSFNDLCINLTETEACMTYFQNKPKLIDQCR